MKHLILALTVVFVAGAGTSWAGGSWTDSFESGVGSTWGGHDGKAVGVADNTRAHTGVNSMRVEQTPTEMRPHRLASDSDDALSPTTGTMTVWVYDDGADLKGFDIRIWDDSNLTASLGLRDTVVANNTEYVYGFNNVVYSTGITRSIGWHKFEFGVSDAGTELRIDDQTWPGRFKTGHNRIRRVLVFTNFGSPSDSNQVWVDDFAFVKGGLLVGGTAASAWQNFE